MNELICPWCNEKFTIPSGKIKVCPNPDCGRPIGVNVFRMFEDSDSTIPVPNRPMDYIQNPQKDND